MSEKDRGRGRQDTARMRKADSSSKLFIFFTRTSDGKTEEKEPE